MSSTPSTHRSTVRTPELGGQAERAGMLGALARQEIRNYLRLRMFWVGAIAIAALCVYELVAGHPEQGSTSGDGLLPAAAIGLVGISSMAGLVRRSDHAAAAAGAVGVSKSTRTVALAIAVVVPAAVGLVWFACALAAYWMYPPSPDTVPFDGFGHAQVMANMFAEGVVPCIGGPMLGLVIGRWLPGRVAPVLISVAIVPPTMILQPLVDGAWRWHMVWIWTHFVAPTGVPGDPERFVASPGSVWFYNLYLLSLCALGVVVALWKDADVDHAQLVRVLAGTLAVVVVFMVSAILVGPDRPVPNPVPSPASVSAIVSPGDSAR